MKLIVGLGNPGQQYDKTRHNAGFMVVDELARRHAPTELAKSRFNAVTLEPRIESAAGGAKALIMKPTTFMNRSGQAVGEAVRFFKLDPATDILVVVDDKDLDIGRMRLRPAGGSGGHNGLKDIDRVLGFAGENEGGYPRLRVGIGNVPEQIAQVDWVLSRFRTDELPELDASIKRAADAVAAWAIEGIEPAMNTFNTKAPSAW